MTNIPSRSIQARLLIATGVLFLPFLLITLLGIYFTNRTSAAFRATVSEVFAEIDPAYAVLRLMNGASMAVHDHLVDKRPEDVERFYIHRRELDAAFVRLRTTTPFDRDEERELAKKAEAAWLQAADLGEDLIKASPFSPDESPIYSRMKLFDERMSASQLAMDKLVFVMKEEIDDEGKRIVEYGNQFILFSALAFSTGLALVLVGLALFRQIILKPIGTLSHGVIRFGQGDLAFRVPPNMPGEIGQLAVAFNQMAEKLDETYKTLEEKATRDDLTGLLNSREFHVRLGNEISRAERYHHPLSLIMLDLDHFKVVNDTHGHQAGDEVLRSAARLVSLIVRPSDHVARYGGEEFVVICPETAPEEAENLAERIRKCIDENTIKVRGIPIHLTASLGIAGFPDDAATGDNLIARADTALYASKGQGRNRVMRFSME